MQENDDINERTTYPVFTTRKPWWNISIANKREIYFKDELYDSIYKLILCVGYPSMKEQIYKMSIFKMHQSRIVCKPFEIDESFVLRVLLQIIVLLCKNDDNFIQTLLKTRSRIIINNDYEDVYFGNPRNMYGKCLMKVRDEYLYRTLNFVNKYLRMNEIRNEIASNEEENMQQETDDENDEGGEDENDDEVEDKGECEEEQQQTNPSTTESKHRRKVRRRVRKNNTNENIEVQQQSEVNNKVRIKKRKIKHSPSHHSHTHHHSQK